MPSPRSADRIGALEATLAADKQATEQKIEELDAALRREKLERAVAEGALETARKDFSRLMREVMATAAQPAGAGRTDTAARRQRRINRRPKELAASPGHEPGDVVLGAIHGPNQAGGQLIYRKASRRPLRLAFRRCIPAGAESLFDMPYRVNAELPASVRNHLPEHAQDIYRAGVQPCLSPPMPANGIANSART